MKMTDILQKLNAPDTVRIINQYSKELLQLELDVTQKLNALGIPTVIAHLCVIPEQYRRFLKSKITFEEGNRALEDPQTAQVFIEVMDEILAQHVVEGVRIKADVATHAQQWVKDNVKKH